MTLQRSKREQHHPLPLWIRWLILLVVCFVVIGLAIIWAIQGANGIIPVVIITVLGIIFGFLQLFFQLIPAHLLLPQSKEDETTHPLVSSLSKEQHKEFVEERLTDFPETYWDQAIQHEQLQGEAQKPAELTIDRTTQHHSGRISIMHYSWRTLPNPFLNFPNLAEIVRQRISGRYTDILGLLVGGSSAIILSGAPRIGKSKLVHYLQDTSHPEWSWRKEIAGREAGKELNLDKKYFVQVNLHPLKTAGKVDELFGLFVTQCALALQKIYQTDVPVPPTDLKGLRGVLRSLNQNHPDAQYILMLDSIERLDRADMQFSGLEAKEGKTATERGLALLNECRAIRVLIDLIDEFNNIGVILSIESLPSPTSTDQFTHVSADLARFTTIPLQTFSWDDTKQYLAQEPQDFDRHWAQQFRNLGGEHIFTPGEQAWILEQAGTHPYLLQQICFHTFDFKKVYASMYGWKELQENDKRQIIEVVAERISTFLSGLRKRLQGAVDKGGPEVLDKLNEFMDLLTSKQMHEGLPYERWQHLGAEMRYILRSEGIIRYDPFQPIHLPGAILSKYLIQQGGMKSTITTRNFQLIISYPGKEKEQLILSELEYGLIKTLIQHPRQCQEIELMKGAWGKPVGHSTFTQRMYHLRKKLEDVSEGTEVIANQYGGLYSLNHPEWLNVE